MLKALETSLLEVVEAEKTELGCDAPVPASTRDTPSEAAGDVGEAPLTEAHDVEAEKAAARDAAILRQVEFYFSDENLATDEVRDQRPSEDC